MAAPKPPHVQGPGAAPPTLADGDTCMPATAEDPLLAAASADPAPVDARWPPPALALRRLLWDADADSGTGDVAPPIM